MIDLMTGVRTRVWQETSLRGEETGDKIGELCPPPLFPKPDEQAPVKWLFSMISN